MQTIQHQLQQIFSDLIEYCYGNDLPPDSHHRVAEVMQVSQEQFGHYQCNNALKIAKDLKKNPREVAENIVSCFSAKKDSFCTRVEVAGPGFINVTIAPSFLAQEISELLKDKRLGVSLPEKILKIIVEFSSPNIAKELHVGHLRSTIIGDCIARLFEFLGHDVLRLNHVGDWGTQFGMLISYLKTFHAEVFAGHQLTDLPQLMKWYRAAKKLFDEDLDFKKKSQLEVVKLQSGDPVALTAWQMICDISRKGFQEIYDLMDVSLIERGESYYNPFLAEVVKDLENKGMVTLSGGAKCVFLEGFVTREGQPLPMIIQKSDGGYNYETTDMAALRHRIDIERADRIICITDAGQALHFQQVFKTAEKAGYFDPTKQQVEHVTFGVVLGPDGKKFKTRSGETEKLIDLLFEAVKKADEIFKERLPDISDEERKQLSLALGIGAVKYADLACHRVKDYVFSYERMLKFEGNTAAFLMYAFVRIEGIKRKNQKNLEGLIQSTPVVITHSSEVSLALHLLRFGETLDSMAKDLLPNRLTDYLYVLAEKFNAFYRDCRVEGVPEEESRLLLCEASSRILEKGLYILGLRTVNRM
ncbi:MAG: arginine--tRNA ligase [Chlamydiae bacterium]|nr:arginine--tRNA ligase [Chlamydiota bacterium]